MARKDYTPEQAIGMLREAEVRLSQGEKIGKICRALRISEQSYWWRRLAEELVGSCPPFVARQLLLGRDQRFSPGSCASVPFDQRRGPLVALVETRREKEQCPMRYC
jgi:hypothetical protein